MDELVFAGSGETPKKMSQQACAARRLLARAYVAIQLWSVSIDSTPYVVQNDFKKRCRLLLYNLVTALFNDMCLAES